MIVQHDLQGRDQRAVVLQRLAHAHHHHVVDDPLALGQAQPHLQLVLGMPELRQDLPRTQVAAETLVARGAKAATYRTARL